MWPSATVRARPWWSSGCAFAHAFAAGRRVARVADRELAVQAREAPLVEHLRHEPEVAQRGQPAVLGDGDPGRLLAAVLQRVEPEVGEPRDVAVGRADAEDAAHLATRPRARRRRPTATSTRRDATITPGPSATSDVGVDAATTPQPRAARARRRRRRRRARARRGARSPDEARRARGRRRAGAARGRRAASGGIRVTSRTRPTQPTTGVGGIGRAAGLVVERDVARRRRGCRARSAARAMPSIACASSQPISGSSGLPKLRQSVSASGSPPAQATLSAASITAPQPAARTGRARRAAGRRATRRSRASPSIRSTAASSPGRRTVREPTSWSYCSNTHVFGSSFTGCDRRARDRARRAARPRSAGTRR